MNRSCYGKMHYCLFLILLSFSSVLAFSQGSYNTTNWRFSNPKQFGFTVLDVDYFDNNNVIAVGSDGGIAKSIDGGRNWTYGIFTFTNPAGQTIKTTLNDVHYISAAVAYAVGNNGCVAKTTDGGATWSFVNNPLFGNQRIINACFFLDDNRGYIGGQFNTPDSLPKLYVTTNGGATWDSISAPPVNGVTRCGYINNPNIPSVLLPVDAKAKEIHRIEFLPNGIGYISGSGSPLFPRVSSNASSTTCLPLTGNLTTGAHTAALLWKLENGVLTDYSISKERIGYTGINTNTVGCTTGFSNLSPSAQTYKAMN
ncbi:MAG TPA: YCF48-related protein, partial [Chitinophagaceae bacterium]|nr:YCF48-related protein [Chitinophagaceae bacterium]